LYHTTDVLRNYLRWLHYEDDARLAHAPPRERTGPVLRCVKVQPEWRQDADGATAPEHVFRVLYEVAVAASGVLDPDRLSEVTVEGARRVTEADAAWLFWWVPERERLILLAEDPPGSTPPASRTMRRGEGAAGQAFADGAVQAVDDYEAWPHARPSTVATGVRSVLAVPLSVGGRPAGALGVRKLDRRHWQRHEAEVLSLLAALAAPALDAARRHADLEASQESFRAVYEDAEQQLLGLVRELSLYRTEPTPRGEPLSMSEAQALTELRGGEPLSQTELAVRLRLEKSTVSRLVTQMEGRLWLRRHRDAEDARLIRLSLTPQGQALADHLAATRTSRLQGVLDTIPPDDRESVVQAMKVVLAALSRG
jgi:DNA-binding MarR family transcriptional regulator